MLAAVCLHVLSEGEFFTAFRAAEGLLTSVQILMLMEEAAIFEGLATDVAQVRARAVRVLAAVVLHDGVVFENHAALGAFVGFQGGVTSLVEVQSHGVWESLTAFLACEAALLGVVHHVLSDRHLKLELLSAQGAVVRLINCVGAVVVPQLIHCGEDRLTFCTLKTTVLRRFNLPLWSKELLLLLFMFIPVFNEAAAVLKSKAAFFTGEGRELVLMCVKVPVKVERLAAVEGLPALLAHQTALFWLHCQISILLFDFIILDHVLYTVDFAQQHLSLLPLCALLL